MFGGALPFPFLVSRLRESFWLDGYEMLARAPIKSSCRRLDRLNYSQLG
jgi:hypothetical protein